MRVCQEVIKEECKVYVGPWATVAGRRRRLDDVFGFAGNAQVYYVDRRDLSPSKNAWTKEIPIVPRDAGGIRRKNLIAATSLSVPMNSDSGVCL